MSACELFCILEGSEVVRERVLMHRQQRDASMQRGLSRAVSARSGAERSDFEDAVSAWRRRGSRWPTPIHDDITAPMMLPKAHRATVDRAKVTDYLLNHSHPDNGGKAAFFSRLGFSRKHWRVLADALRAQAAESDSAAAVASRHGEKYILEGRLRTPCGRAPVVRSVWIIERGSAAPRLVTAYPVKEDSQ